MLESNNHILVKAEGLSKKFCKDLKTSLWYGIKDLGSNLFGNQKQRELRPKEFWALKDINFELRRGECLGLIGHNGAGKSTLLKILNGLIKPDEGKVTIKGRVGALIELGAGFNPILSGRENIYNNGAVLGFTKKEIHTKLQAIIDFAEIEEFIDMPVQNYSSGMKVRLGFAVAVQMEPDVLIIDEVLAVGDVGFRMKCLTRIGELLKTTAVIFVSHTMPQVARIANKILLIEKGEELVGGTNVAGGIESYYQSFTAYDIVQSGTGKIKIISFDILDALGNKVKVNDNGDMILTFKSDYSFIINLNVGRDVSNYEIHYSFIDKDTKIIATLYSFLSHEPFNHKGNIAIKVNLKSINFNQGYYSIGIAVNQVNDNGSNGEIYVYNSKVAGVQVIGVKAGVAPIQLDGVWDIKN